MPFSISATCHTLVLDAHLCINYYIVHQIWQDLQSLILREHALFGLIRGACITFTALSTDFRLIVNLIKGPMMFSLIIMFFNYNKDQQ